ncbi:MAG: gephyrin-like molybdotransferase Glp [Paracoccaceae bacterium]
MILVEAALGKIFDLITPLPSEQVALADAAGRVLAEPAVAKRDQPPFAASAMDGYAARAQDAKAGQTLKLIGSSAAGHGFSGSVSKGQTVRIFTGAPVPTGADTVIIQEDVTTQGDLITIAAAQNNTNIRPQAADFSIGTRLSSPRLLGPSDVALLASMNIPTVTVTRRPIIALLATGDELVMPGDTPGPDQIIASNSFGLAALARQAGATVRLLPISRDTPESLKAAFSLAADADLIITIGGASVGDHDIVADVADSLGGKRSFYKIAMRPGKPLMAGTLGKSLHLGFPGNPVSSMVCGHIFMVPALNALLGLPCKPAPRLRATVTCDIAENGPREHYMRARLIGADITPFDQQDSALSGLLAQSNALLIRPPQSGAIPRGTSVDYIPI